MTLFKDLRSEGSDTEISGELSLGNKEKLALVEDKLIDRESMLHKQ